MVYPLNILSDLEPFGSSYASIKTALKNNSMQRQTKINVITKRVVKTYKLNLSFYYDLLDNTV